MGWLSRNRSWIRHEGWLSSGWGWFGCGWSVVEEWLLSEGACCGGSEAGERRSERGDTAYSPRVPRGGAFGHRRTNLKYGIIYYMLRNRACREKVCNLLPFRV